MEGYVAFSFSPFQDYACASGSRHGYGAYPAPSTLNLSPVERGVLDVELRDSDTEMYPHTRRTWKLIKRGLTAVYVNPKPLGLRDV